MTSIAPIIIAQAKMGLGYAERLVSGVRPDQFARLASPGGETLKSNHPAFVFGHLALYPAKALTLIGRPVPEAAKLSSNYDELFKAGAECRDDADGKLYPPMDEVMRHFTDSYKAAIESISTVDDETLLKPNPNEGRMKELFPTIGAAVTFYLGGHVQMHLGQISAWRRAMGLAAAM